ncbi:hypothetical protein GCM10027321_14250 [Massilia terrae]|uniref:Lipoprotein n=1 Tax=Massilia terrae TaxID=1811224 RepID=A0ABT2CV97_9BURK|nr:hypothetical protein [Massilia terrae]MCS0657730.1 hypothetical protein [Massilia terrae]
MRHPFIRLFALVLTVALAAGCHEKPPKPSVAVVPAAGFCD